MISHQCRDYQCLNISDVDFANVENVLVAAGLVEYFVVNQAVVKAGKLVIALKVVVMGVATVEAVVSVVVAVVTVVVVANVETVLLAAALDARNRIAALALRVVGNL